MNKPLRASLVSGLLIVIAAAMVWLVGATGRGPATGPGTVIIAEGTQPIAAPVYVADAKHFFADEGVDVRLVSFATGKLCLDALIGGKADLATVAETPIMHASFSYQPIRVVATMHRSRDNTFCMVRGDRGIKVPADLKGQTVAVPFGTNAEYAFGAFLANAGIKPADLHLVNLSPPEMVGPLTRGDVAAVVAWQPHAGRCERALGANGLRWSFDQVYEETYNLVAGAPLTAARPETLVKTLRALDRAVTYMSEHPDDAIAIVARRIGMEEAELRALWPTYHFGLDLRLSLVDTLTKQAQWAVQQEQQTGSVPDMKGLMFSPALRAVSPHAVEVP